MKIFLPIVVLLVSFGKGFGCSYLGYPEPPLSFIISKTKTIYIGTVISKKTSREKDSDGDLYRIERIKLKVEKVLKGVDSEIQEITIADQIGIKDSCYVAPPKLKIGEKWIIQKDFEKGNEPRENIRFIFTRLYLKYDEKFHPEYIEKVEKLIQNPATGVYGQVQTNPAYPSIEGIQVFIDGNGIQLSTKTGRNGDYSFENIPAGNYKIQIRFPSRTKDLYNNQETIYNEKTKTYNLEYEASISAGVSDFYYVTTTGTI